MCAWVWVWACGGGGGGWEEGGAGGESCSSLFTHYVDVMSKKKVGTVCTCITMRMQWHWTGWPGYFIIYCALTFGPKVKIQRRLDRLVGEDSLSSSTKHPFMTTHEHHFGLLKPR